VVTPKQKPDEYLVSSDHEIDFPYLVAVGEANLILQVEDLGGSSSASPVFVALDAGASLKVDPALRAIKPTKIGADAREPAALGEKVTTEDFEVTVREMVRGDAAYARLLEANKFNDPPKDGTEYLLAFVEVRSISTKDNTVLVSGSDFYSVIAGAPDVEATALKYTSAVEPAPELSFYLYPGGQAAGWVAVAIPKNNPNVRLVFASSFGSNDLNTRYFAINKDPSLVR
jgi:hypothetical protein